MLFNEPKLLKLNALARELHSYAQVSVLFNEPKLLKSKFEQRIFRPHAGFSALQRAEIAEIDAIRAAAAIADAFQCSSTSRNC